MAEEVSQNILCAMSKKSAALARQPERLPAWLHRATLFESNKAMRTESSYQRRKSLQHPDEISATDSNSSVWSDILPHLDLALDRLSDADRSVLLQHYYEGKSFPAIAAIDASPAATVQKRCRRALDKLASILRGKNLVITTTTLAAGFTAEFAKAAPPALLQTAAAQALSSSYSTTQLSIYMAAKSKAFIPLALFLSFTPLIFQQVAISRVVRENEKTLAILTDHSPAGQTRSSRQLSVTRRTAGSGRMTIDILSRAYDESQNSGMLKSLAFEKMIENLTADQLAELIPEAIHFPESWEKRSDLLRVLSGALAKTDPERAVRATFAEDPRGEISIRAQISHVLAAWALKEPDSAFSFFQKIYEDRAFNPLTEGGLAWSFNISTLHEGMLQVLITVGSPHARAVILMAPEYIRADALSNSTGMPTEGQYMDNNHVPARIQTQNLYNFIPLIREFIPAEKRNGAFENLVSGVSSFPKHHDEILAGWIHHSELYLDERKMIAESYAIQKMGSYYNSFPLSGSAEQLKIQASTKQWLEENIPNDADEIFAKAKNETYQREMIQVKWRIESMAKNLEILDSDLIQQLDGKFFGEMLPQAIEQAKRIKDPEKRERIIRRLQEI